jgi:hypothetical protein
MTDQRNDAPRLTKPEIWSLNAYSAETLRVSNLPFDKVDTGHKTFI